MNIEERPVPGYGGYFARDDGTIRVPSGKVLRGSLSKTCQHLRILAKKTYWRHLQLLLVHRLVALSFCRNPRPDIFHIVDHINDHRFASDKFLVLLLRYTLNVQTA